MRKDCSNQNIKQAWNIFRILNLQKLSVQGTVVQVCILLEYSLPILSQQFYIWVLPRITPIIVPFIHISLTGSVYSVVAVAIERFLTVCFPFQQCQVML